MEIGDWRLAQQIADGWQAKRIHRKLDEFAQRFCPIFAQLGVGLTLLTERHADQIAGVRSCYDRILVFGTLPNVCFAEGMTAYLYTHQVRIFDYPSWHRVPWPKRWRPARPAARAWPAPI